MIPSSTWQKVTDGDDDSDHLTQMDSVPGFPNLERLYIRQPGNLCTITPLFKSCPKISVLYLDFSYQLSNDQLKAVGKKLKLLVLNLSHCMYVDDDTVTSILQDCKTLMQLFLTNCPKVDHDKHRREFPKCKIYA